MCFLDSCYANSDVRGMCFTCIRDLKMMTAETILAARKCPQLEYAVAYWLYNNHNDELKKYGFKFLYSNEYLNLILDSDNDMTRRHIWECIDDIEIDEHDESDSDSDESAQCCLCSDTLVGSGNNPVPLMNEGRCCDSCNGKVLYARIKALQAGEALEMVEAAAKA